MTENMDPRPLHRRAVAQTGTVVAAVTPDIRGDADVPFGPVVEVSPDAAPYAQLAAWLGRHP